MLLSACGGGDDSAKTDDTGTTNTTSTTDSDTAVTTAASWSADVWPIIEENCSGCHASDASHPGFLLGTQSDAYTSLLTDTPTNAGAGFDAYVVPGDTAASLLYDKIASDAPTYGGSRMPAGGSLSSAQIDVVEAWIAGGAADD